MLANSFSFLFYRFFLHLIVCLGQLPETRDASILADATLKARGHLLMRIFTYAKKFFSCFKIKINIRVTFIIEKISWTSK